MAKADKKLFGAGAKAKGVDTGALTDIETEAIPANAVLSNRDKKGSPERGMDGRDILTEQYQDHAANTHIDPEDDQP